MGIYINDSSVQNFSISFKNLMFLYKVISIVSLLQDNILPVPFLNSLLTASSFISAVSNILVCAGMNRLNGFEKLIAMGCILVCVFGVELVVLILHTKVVWYDNRNKRVAINAYDLTMKQFVEKEKEG